MNKNIITLINPPFNIKKGLLKEEKKYYSIFEKKLSKIYPTYKDATSLYDVPEIPLWITNIGAVLEELGIEVDLIDLVTMKEYDENFLIKKIGNAKSRIFGISCFTSNYYYAVKIAKIIRRLYNNTAVIIIGGCHATFTDEQCIKDGFDIVVRGEGELIAKDLFPRLLRNESINNIKGVTFKKGNDIIKNQNAPLIKNLDRLPLPAFHLLPEVYKKIKPYDRVYCSRGCPYNCSFCADKKFWGACSSLRYYSIKRVIKTIKLMQDKLNTKIFYIGDQSFTANMDYVKNFCIASKKENLVWSCQTRVNLVNEEIAKTMKNAGCLEVCFGAESYNQKILNLNNKMTKVSEIPKALSICKKKGLNTHTYWLCGLPGESRTSAKKTITAIESLITKKLSDMAGYFIVVPYPGTDIFNNPQKYGIKIISRDFSLYKEDQKPVMETEYLKSNEIYDIWKKGLSRIANALEKTV